MKKHQFGNLLISVICWFANKAKENGVWNLFFSIAKALLSLFGLKALPICSMSYFSEKNMCDRITLYKKREGVSVLSTSPFVEEQQPVFRQFDKLFLTCCQDVLIAGNSDIIVDSEKKLIISDFCYNQSVNVYSSDTLLLRDKRNWGILRKKINKKPRIIESGIMIVGKFSNNYYHALYENLNRCMLIDDILIPTSVPILVDKSVLSIPSLRSLMGFMIQGVEREIIPVENGELCLCKKLFYFDHINYIVSQRHRLGNVTLKEMNFYDPLLLKKQKELLIQNMSNNNTPRRVFLSRSHTAHRNYNEDDIFFILEKYGFKKIIPEKMSIEDQMALFNNAECIIGGSGAAFSNIIFCKSGCKVLCFRAIKGDVGTSIFKSIAWINGVALWHYPADDILNKQGAHANYYISPSKFESFLINDWHISIS